jgi:hypothetical protein
MLETPKKQLFREYFFEYLPQPKKERLQEIITRKHDPLLLPYRVGFSAGRSLIWAVVLVSLSPGLLSFWLWLLSLGFLLVAVGLGALVAKYLAIRFPSFWYVHPSFLISSHEDVIQLYSWSSLQFAEGRGGSLRLGFPGISFTLSCPQRNAQEYAELVLGLSRKNVVVPDDLLEVL